MPIKVPSGLQRLDYEQFGRAAYEVIIGLYEEALTHFHGGVDKVLQPVGISVGGSQAGNQLLHLAAPGVAFKLSALGGGRQRYESHLRRFLAHTSLDCIQWINVGRKVVTFKTLKR
jgi:hypothetical protein